MFVAFKYFYMYAVEKYQSTHKCLNEFKTCYAICVFTYDYFHYRRRQINPSQRGVKYGVPLFLETRKYRSELCPMFIQV